MTARLSLTYSHAYVMPLANTLAGAKRSDASWRHLDHLTMNSSSAGENLCASLFSLPLLSKGSNKRGTSRFR